MKVPTEEVARTIAGDLGIGRVIKVERFGTGKAHYVYDVTTEGDEVVIRLTRAKQQADFVSAYYWYELLKPKGIPLPTIRKYDLEGKQYGFPMLAMDRLPGKDLWHVYVELSREQKENLATEIVHIQEIVGGLEPAKGFGYARSYNDTDLYDSWKGVMDHYMRRITRRNEKTKLIEEKYIERLRELYEKFEVYFNEVRPTAFLDDTTTKNVIIDQGKLSGIVDVDYVCFGDPLFVLGLTRMSLLDLRVDTEYTDFWEELLHLNDVQRKVVDLYSAMFGLEFASAMGHVFNRDTEEDVDMEALGFRLAMFEALTKGL